MEFSTMKAKGGFHIANINYYIIQNTITLKKNLILFLEMISYQSYGSRLAIYCPYQTIY